MLEDQHVVMDVRQVQCDPCLGVGPPPMEYNESDSESEESGSDEETDSDAGADRDTIVENDVRLGDGKDETKM